MEKMEVSLKYPANDVSENEMDDTSNLSVLDNLNNPSATDSVITCIDNTSAENGQKSKCNSTSNQEPTIGINSTVNSLVSNCNQSGTKLFGITPLNNAIQPIQNPLHDLKEHVRNEGELSREKDNGSLKSDLPITNEVCVVPESGDSIGEPNTECSNKKVLEERKANMNLISAAIVNLSLPQEKDYLINSYSKGNDPTSENSGAESNSLEQDYQDNGNKSIKHDKNVSLRDSTDISKVKQQSSEIKDRVMSYLSKYVNVDEASCGNASPDTSLVKQECLKIKPIHVFNTDDNATDVPAREKIENRKKNDGSILDVDPPVTNSMTPKLRFVRESKKMGTPDLSQSWHFELPVQNSPVNFTKARIKENNDDNNNNKDNFESNSNNSFQTKHHFPGSHTGQVPTTGNTSENDPRVSSAVKANCDVEDACDSETGSPQLKFDSVLNMLVPTKLQENPHCNSDSNFLSQSCYLNFNSKNENAKENELKTSAFSSSNFCGNGMRVSENTHSYVFNSPRSYEGQHSLQRSNTDNSVYSLISPWEKMSFQPQTTPSINSPILSSKSNDDNRSLSTGYTGFSGSKPHIFHSDNEDSEMPAWSSKFGNSSRKAKSSEAVYFSGLVPFSTGEANNFNITNDRTVDDSFFKTSRDDSGTSCSKFFEIDGENASYMCNFSGNNSNVNFQCVSPDSNAKQSNDHKSLFPSWENLSSDSIYNGSPLLNSPFKVNSNNPFAKKLPVESIGLFASPSKITISGTADSGVKSVSSPLIFVSPRKGKMPNQTPDFCRVEDKSSEQTSILKVPLQFLVPSKLGNDSDKMEQASLEFASNVSKEEPSVFHGKKYINYGQVLNEESRKRSNFLKPDRLSFASDGGGSSNSSNSSSSSNSSCSNDTVPFQFTLCPQNRKILRRVSFPRIKEPIKTLKWNEKCFSNSIMDLKENRNIAERGIDVPFKPEYGSDMKVECGVNKNVFVRYQNVVFMKEFVNVSPEELRLQFYSKMTCEPFKFSARPESGKAHGYKKNVSQESQTDEDLTNEKKDMAGIWRVLECPVCLDVVLPPVYQCEQGHHVCSACWKKVVSCPLCKRRKSNTRNYMAEALIEQVPLPCRYHIEGCKESVQQDNKVSHEETCLFRTYQCPVPQCNEAHCYQNMCKHFKNVHKTLLHHEGHSVSKGEKFCDVLYKESVSFSMLVHAFDISKWGLFFLQEVTVQKSTALFVQVMPAAPNQAAYFYHLEVSDHHDCRKESYKGRVFPIAKLTKEVVREEEYLCLSELLLKTVKKSTPLKIVVTIWQLKPAFTISA